MLNGVVKWWDESAGEGYIEHEGKAYYVHYSALPMESGKAKRDLVDGERVKFTLYDFGYLKQVDSVVKLCEYN